MAALDRLVPNPGLVEIDRVDLAAPPEQVWQRVRHAALAHAPATRALFALRTLFDRATNHSAPTGLKLDDLRSSPEEPGFRVLIDEPPKGPPAVSSPSRRLGLNGSGTSRGRSCSSLSMLEARG